MLLKTLSETAYTANLLAIVVFSASYILFGGYYFVMMQAKYLRFCCCLFCYAIFLLLLALCSNLGSDHSLYVSMLIIFYQYLMSFLYFLLDVRCRCCERPSTNFDNTLI